jgi:hypothetical protein
MTSDAQYGSFKFYVNPGHYDLTFTKPGYTFEPIDDMQVPADTVTLGTMATQNANAVAITGGTIALLAAAGGAVRVDDAGASAQVALRSLVTVGASKYNVLADGTAQNTFIGNVGLGTFTPSYPLDVTGQARITGTLGIGTAPSASYHLYMVRNKASVHGLVFQPTGSDAGTNEVMFLNVAGTIVGSIQSTAAATSFNTSSDARLKHAIAPLSGSLAVLAALRPVAFRWNADDSVGHGFLAHELQATIPEAVSGLPDEVNPDGSVKPQQVDHSRLVPWLTAVCQELAQQVQVLTQRVSTLEEQLGL